MNVLSTQTIDKANAQIKPNTQINTADVGIVHLGFGAFHRAHQALITNRVMKEHGGNWKIVGVNNWRAAGKFGSETGIESEFASQDNLYTVAVGQDDRVELEVIGAIQSAI